MTSVEFEKKKNKNENFEKGKIEEEKIKKSSDQNSKKGISHVNKENPITESINSKKEEYNDALKAMLAMQTLTPETYFIQNQTPKTTGNTRAFYNALINSKKKKLDTEK